MASLTRSKALKIAAVLILVLALFDLVVYQIPTLMLGQAAVDLAATTVGGPPFFMVLLGAGSFPLFDAAPPWYLSVITLALLALTARPVWRWVQPRVHDLVFGIDDPNIAVIEQISAALASTALEAAHLTTLAETIVHIVRLPYARIELWNGQAGTAGTPSNGGLVRRVELTNRGAIVGRLEVMSRLPGEPLTASEEQLLASLARQISITLHVAQLSDALQASREQLVLAREEERRRIRRDLHDGLAPTLAGLRWQLTALRQSVREQPQEAEAVIEGLRRDVRLATAEIRRLVYDLRPPMLDEFGLLGALQHLGPAADALVRSVEAAEPLPPLPAALEVAVYRIAAEAVQNVVRHAGATRCWIRLSVVDGSLRVTITDDGRGLPEHYLAGVGHRAMSERAEELGGSLTIGPAPGQGTRVLAEFPLKGGRHG